MSEGTRPDVSAIVVTYNSAHDIEHCLTALEIGTSRRALEIVVLDNASTDDTLRRVARSPGRKVLAASANLGFARGVNAAVAEATGSWVLLVNPDAVVEPGSVDRLLDFAEAHPGAGPVGGRTLREDGSVDPRSCWGPQTLWSTFCFATGLSRLFKNSRVFDPESMGSWRRDTVREVATVTGYFMAIRREHWDALGGFDPAFWMYGDDVDLSARARRLGLRPTVTPTAVAVHEGGASSVEDWRIMMILRGRVTVMQKSWPAWQRAAGRALLLLGAGVRAAAAPSSPWGEVWRRRREWIKPYERVERGLSVDEKGSPVSLKALA